MTIEPQKVQEFAKLFSEFAASYPSSPEGQRHIQRYPECRQQGEANFQAAVASAGRGEDVTDFVLLKLLPYENTAPNRGRGAWIHIAPSVTKDIKSWFEGARWTKPEDWPKIARAILSFVQRCVGDPSQLPAACAGFAALSFAKGLQTGMLTPILNALRPDDFLLVNTKSRQAINYFAGTGFSLGLRDYPGTNDAGKGLIAVLGEVMKPASSLNMRACDLFDMFSHWLVAVKGPPWKTGFWKIAPGDNAWQWAECREKGFIAIGWDELGDLSGLTRGEFDARRDELIKKDPDYTKQGIEQAWKFSRVDEGDRIVANHGTTAVLGIGTVTGPYYFVPGVRYGHRLPVKWDDVTVRGVDEGGWRRTLIELEREEFDAICQAPPVSVAGAADGGVMALAESDNPQKGWKFARWMGPILDALRALGGSATASAVLLKVPELTTVPDGILSERLASGQTRFYNEAHWARKNLVWEGLVESPERGMWRLTARGQNTNLDEREAQKIVEKWAERHRQEAEMRAEEPPFFTAKTFELLADLHETPTKAFYAAHKAELKEHLEEPFRRLFDSVRESVREEIRECMETEKRVFSRILKNDYGVGGAWEFLWGAFYPKGGERTKDVQLWVSMHRERVEAGFSFGEYSQEKQRTFLVNLAKHREVLASWLEPRFASLHVFYGSREDLEASLGGTPRAASFAAWAAGIDDLEASVRVHWPEKKVLELSGTELSEEIANLFNELFPLVLLAIEEDPLPAIRDYLQVGNGVPVGPPVFPPPPSSPPQLQPEYPLATYAAETGFEVATLETWKRAINRKGQAIIYGPPGTGKTFMAEKLAAHLIGGGDGFSELVQFHPAYAYEDFMQGLRPQRTASGGLHYPLVPGRFLEFCKRAATCKGPCVLIIDEINRANLARVFGELMYLLEYRKREIPLAGGGTFRIPEHVRLIGTMNTADRSIALVDHALRRRFGFIALYPRYEVLREFHARQETGFATTGLIEQLKRVNEAIADPHYHLGLSFFLRTDLATQLPDIWQMEIEPYLEEFFFDQPEKFAQFRWENVKANVLP
jgi:5-methylcytosine-specific restriction protein B